MFEKSLALLFEKIFDVNRVTYDAPDPDAPEQEALFLQIQTADVRIRDKEQTAKVTGRAGIYANSEKLPFGYLAKCIAEHIEDTKDLFFYDVDENSRRYQNIVERTFSFVYFFRGQYDPDVGIITDVTINVEVTP